MHAVQGLSCGPEGKCPRGNWSGRLKNDRAPGQRARSAQSTSLLKPTAQFAACCPNATRFDDFPHQTVPDVPPISIGMPPLPPFTRLPKKPAVSLRLRRGLERGPQVAEMNEWAAFLRKTASLPTAFPLFPKTAPNPINLLPSQNHRISMNRAEIPQSPGIAGR